jgi:hypothetical protein
MVIPLIVIDNISNAGCIVSDLRTEHAEEEATYTLTARHIKCIK